MPKNTPSITKLKKLMVKLRKIVSRQKNKNITIILLSAMVGLIVGLAAILIKQIIYTIENYAVSFFPGYLFFVLPMIGLLLVTFLNGNIFKKLVDFKGMQHVIKAIENHQSFINIRLIYAKFVTAGITIGFGGSSGMEAAIVTSGASIGSNLGKSLGLNYQLRTLLIGCGTASGISAMYNAPIGGFLFALEVILPEFTPALLIPLLIASATGKILFEMIMGENLRFDAHVDAFSYESLPYVILIGVVGAFTAIYMIKTYGFCYKVLSRLNNPYLMALVGGGVLGCLIYIFPALYGEGYVSINRLLHGQESEVWKNSIFQNLNIPFQGLLILLVLLLLRPLSTGLSLSAGGEGGYFAPSLVAGGISGYLLYKIIIAISGTHLEIEGNTFIFLGMAATFACVMRAPVTAIFLIADTTQSYAIIVPLMIATTIAYTFKNYLDAHHPLTKDSHGPLQMEKFILNQINLRDIIEPVNTFVYTNYTLRKIIEHFSNHDHAIIPVLNSHNEVVGVIELKTVRELMKNFEQYDSIVAEQLLQKEFTIIDYAQLRNELINTPELIKLNHVLVKRKENIIGYVSKYKVLNMYNQYLNHPDRLFVK
jgi:CIC family chloride channel protein